VVVPLAAQAVAMPLQAAAMLQVAAVATDIDNLTSSQMPEPAGPVRAYLF